jgi:hypothetical protein
MSENDNKKNKSLMRQIDSTSIDRIRNAYHQKKDILQNINGINLYHEPFTHCVIDNLIDNNDFINEMKKDIKSKLKYFQKNNDLYKFHQVIVTLIIFFFSFF